MKLCLGIREKVSPTFDLALSDFYQRVYAVCRYIPSGKVTSYGAIAKFLGAARSARMVGYALNSSLGVEGVPAHRVLNRLGMLSGKHYFGSSTLMQELLENEGIEVKDDQVQRFKDHFWDPADHLEPQEF